MEEEWRPVLGWEGFYEVSSLGRVRSLDHVVTYSSGFDVRVRGRVLRPSLAGRYMSVTLSRNRKRVTGHIHQMVAEAFCGPRPNGYFACHANDIKHDNRAVNIRWASPSENNRDAVRNGRIALASKTHCKHGHPFDGANLYVTKTGARMCKRCRADRMLKYRALRSEVATERAEAQLYSQVAP